MTVRFTVVETHCGAQPSGEIKNKMKMFGRRTLLTIVACITLSSLSLLSLMSPQVISYQTQETQNIKTK